MPWLVRYVPSDNDEPQSRLEPLERHDLLVSKLWNLGTAGVFEQGSELVAGFDVLETARRAAGLAARNELVARVEEVDDNWIRPEETEVTIATANGPITFGVVAGPAFGHGAHPTTRICLDLMARVLVGEGPSMATGAIAGRVLDLGTGSGVLAVAAHHMGATTITACDIDEAAIESARFNSALNGADVEFVLGDVEALEPHGVEAGDGFDLIVANVLLPVHERVAGIATRLLRADGTLILAGFLDHQTDRVVEAYRRHRPTLRIGGGAAIDQWRGRILTDDR